MVMMFVGGVVLLFDGLLVLGVVHAWVGQKHLNCYILSVAVIASYFHISA